MDRRARQAITEGEGRRPIDGRSLVLLRAYRGMSQRELAERSGIERRAISKIEKGKAVMTPEERSQIARALRVPPFLLDDFSESVRHADQVCAARPDLGGDLGEDHGDSRRLLRYEKHSRIAESVGRSTTTAWLTLLEAAAGGTYDDL